MATIVESRDAAAATHGDARWRFYRAVWRWHFYAGLLVLPWLAWLALTGAAFTYHRAIDRAVHHHLLVVAPVPAGQALPPQRLVQAALQAHPGQVFSYTTAASAEDAVQVGVQAAHGRREVVYVDPADAHVLGALPDRGTTGWVIRRLHSLAIAGPVAQALIEIAAGWSVLLVLTGVYLWLPRGRRGGVVTVRGTPRQRLFWRDLHAVVGIGAGALVLFLALSGMPWTVLWGAWFNRAVNGHDYGYPAGVRVQVPMSDATLQQRVEMPWSLRQAQLPESAMASMPAMQMHAGHAAHAGHATAAGNAHHGGGDGDFAVQPGAIGLDAAIAAFDNAGIGAGYAVAMPQGARGVYSATLYNGMLAQQRVIHVDQYSGRVLLDMGYADYGVVGRSAEWLVNVHLGDQFGALNRLALLLACALTLLLCASAAVMWWKRRPQGGLGVPPLPPQPRTLRVVTALLLVGGVVFPLVGISLLLIWLLDRLWLGRRPSPGDSG